MLSNASASPLHASNTVSPLKRKAMSITQTYYLAHTARGKLSHEASRADHNLRLLVGHANLLDSLMVELAEAEQEQESWFNQSVRSASPAATANKHIQWADAIVEEAEDADSSDSESDSDFEEEDEDETAAAGLVRFSSTARASYNPKATFDHDQEFEEKAGEDEPEFEDDGEEDFTMLTLTRTNSRTAAPPSPPELLLSHDDSDSSDEETMPPSPPNTHIPGFSESNSKAPQQSQAQAGKLSPTEQQSFFDEGYYLPARRQGLVSAISVY